MAAHLRKEHPQLSLTSSQEESLCIRSCPHCHKYYLPGSLPSHERSCNQKLKKTKAPSPSAPSSSCTSSDPSFSSSLSSSSSSSSTTTTPKEIENNNIERKTYS